MHNSCSFITEHVSIKNLTCQKSKEWNAARKLIFVDGTLGSSNTSFTDVGAKRRQEPIRKFHVFDTRKVGPSRENTRAINHRTLALQHFSLSRFLICFLYTTVDGARWWEILKSNGHFATKVPANTSLNLLRKKVSRLPTCSRNINEFIYRETQSFCLRIYLTTLRALSRSTINWRSDIVRLRKIRKDTIPILDNSSNI